MIALGFHHRGVPSARRLAEAAGVAVNAVLRVIYRENYGEQSLEPIGEAMRDPGFVYGWVGQPLGEAYTPPTSSRRLTQRQRVLVDDLIRELTTMGESDAGNTHQKSPGPGEPGNGGNVTPFPTRDDIPDDLAAYETGQESGSIIPAQEKAGEEDQDA